MELFLTIILGIAAQRGSVNDAENARLRSFAQDIWNVSAESTLMCGPAAQEATAIMLLAVATHESGLWSKVADCSACYRGSPFCDKGKSISAWQLHEHGGAWLTYTREQICSDNALAARLALRILERHQGGMSPATVLAGYARGGRRQAGAEMAAIFASMARTANIYVARQYGCLTARKHGTR